MIKHSRTTSTLSLAALALAITAAAGSAIAADATTTATSTVVAPLTITKAADLAFGSFAAGAGIGTVTVSPNNARAVGGAVVAMGGTTTAAQFTVTGQAGQSYSIVVGGDIELSSGTDTMGFTPITDLSASAITSGTVGSATGAQTIYLGGVLAVAANQPAGNYSGSISVTVAYN